MNSNRIRNETIRASKVRYFAKLATKSSVMVNAAATSSNLTLGSQIKNNPAPAATTGAIESKGTTLNRILLELSVVIGCFVKLMHFSIPSARRNGSGEMYSIRQSPVSPIPGVEGLKPEGATRIEPTHQVASHVMR